MKTTTSIVITAISVGCLAAPAAVAGEKNDRACTSTTKAAYRACLFEGLDDFWIATAKCRNFADPGERTDCQRESKAELQGARGDCREQRGARSELCAALGEEPYDPPFEAALFVNPADIGGSVAPNPWLPLIAGRTLVYSGPGETVTVSFTDEVQLIAGVPCAVVRDTAEEGGEVVEDTRDYFAQDVQGNVWYCGEATAEFDGEEIISVDGSFKAGENGAKAGILMEAAPVVGDVYRQEFDIGNAEDAAEVIDLAGSASVPAASCTGDCLVTRDFTPLEPDSFENKYYKPGVGLILETNPATGKRVELIEVRGP